MKYANERGWTQTYPFEVILEVSPITLVVRPMRVKPHPEWAPEFVSGGFAAHCVNQSEQRWLFESNPDAECIRIRKKKRGDLWTYQGREFAVEDEPRYFYDFNF